MKTESTIRREMARLFDLASVTPQPHARVAHDMASALQWVLERTTWTPYGIAAAAAETARKPTEEP